MQPSFAWVDIPVVNLERAIRFYRAVLNSDIECIETPTLRFGLLAHTDDNIGGCLVEGTDNQPSLTGALIYLNVNGRIAAATEQALQLGGEILQATHAIGEHGFRAIIVDSEGNRIALHSR